MILIFMALFISMLNRNIKRNYKETKWLLYSTVLCFFTWVAWITLYLVLDHEFRDTVIVVELVACATILLGFLFGPKIYILLSYEPVVVAFKRDPFPNHTDLFEKGLLNLILSILLFNFQTMIFHHNVRCLQLHQHLLLQIVHHLDPHTHHLQNDLLTLLDHFH